MQRLFKRGQSEDFLSLEANTQVLPVVLSMQFKIL